MQANRLSLILLSLCAFWISSIYSAPTTKEETPYYDGLQTVHHRSSIQDSSSAKSPLQRRGSAYPKIITDWDIWTKYLRERQSASDNYQDPSIPKNIAKAKEVSDRTYEYRILEKDAHTGANVIRTNRIEEGNKLGSGGFSGVYDATLSYNIQGSKNWHLDKDKDWVIKITDKLPGQMLQGTATQVKAYQFSNYVLDVEAAFYIEDHKEACVIMEKATYGDFSNYVHEYELGNVLFLDVLAAVTEFHDANMMHRDIKPANIMIFKRSQGIVPQYIDFDMATFDETSKDFNVGTPGFSAPEIMKLEEYDSLVDVFALGMTYIYSFGDYGGEANWWLLWKELVAGKSGSPKKWLSPSDVRLILNARLETGDKGYSDSDLELLSNVLCEPNKRISAEEYYTRFKALKGIK